MKKTLLLFFCFFLSLYAWAQKPKIYIFTIGVKDYIDEGIRDLSYADKDADDIALLFQKQTNLYDVRLVKILKDKTATRMAIRDAFTSFQEKVNPEDLFVFFFSGHGVEDALIPNDCKLEDLDATSISRTYLITAIEKMNCNSLVLLDACHSGSFAKGIKDIGTEQRQLSNEEAIRRLIDGFKSHDKMRITLGSSASNKQSFECDECKNGYFAQGIIDAFENIEYTDSDGYAIRPDINRNGYLSPTEFSTYIQDVVKARTAKARRADTRIEIQSVYKREQSTTDAPFIFVGLKGVGPGPTPIDDDGDGIVNSEDKCPTQYGTRANNGCPADGQGSDDYDGDGFADSKDACPTENGTANGCPDADRDGVPDKSDKCKNTAGKPEYEGCPDSDNDGIPDNKDNCPNEKGSKTYSGCPPPKPQDADSDGFPDSSDSCPTEYSTTNNGCPVKNTNANFTENHDGLGLQMIFVQGGTFKMGSNKKDDEKPIHQVTLSDYHIGKSEITQKQWRAVMGNSPSSFKNCDDCPVEKVSWNDVQDFLQKLNAKIPPSGARGKYRLPTEAEWEYAAHGGNKSQGYTYSGSNNIDKVAWYGDNSGDKTHADAKKVNELDIYNMTGNVSEWCSDWYGKEYYSSSSTNNPTGPSSGSYRVHRGGSWGDASVLCRVADRSYGAPENRYYILGFRVVFSQTQTGF